jgi:hypothetical protein
MGYQGAEGRYSTTCAYLAENSGIFEHHSEWDDVGNPGIAVLFLEQRAPALPEPIRSWNPEATSSPLNSEVLK